MSKKVAVIMFNLGGPDSLDAVKPFLFNLFYDPAIITVPNPFRWLIAKIISSRRTPIAQDIYREMGVREYIRIPTVQDSETFIAGLKNLVLEHRV